MLSYKIGHVGYIQPAACFGKSSFSGTQPHSFLTYYLWRLSYYNSKIEYLQQDQMAHKLKTFVVWSFREVWQHLA